MKGAQEKRSYIVQAKISLYSLIASDRNNIFIIMGNRSIELATHGT